jgi:hypothetical protein
MNREKWNSTNGSSDEFRSRRNRRGDRPVALGRNDDQSLISLSFISSEHHMAEPVCHTHRAVIEALVNSLPFRC